MGEVEGAVVIASTQVRRTPHGITPGSNSIEERRSVPVRRVLRYHRVVVDDDDRALLQRWRAGDRAAGEVLLRRHFRSVYAFFANKLGGPVDDLIQDTFRACVEGRDGIRDGSSFRAYLLATARYQLVMHFRRLRPTVELDPSRASVEQLVSSPSVLIARHQDQRLLLAALRGLPLDLQILLELTYWESLTSAEIAEVLGVAVGTVKSRLRRAREALAERFSVLASGEAIRVATVDELERWARSIREELHARGAREAR